MSEKTARWKFDELYPYGLVGLIALAVLWVLIEEYVVVFWPLAAIAAVITGWLYWQRFYDRTKGASIRAWNDAQAASKTPIPPPPNSFSWVEHAIYRDGLKKQPVSEQQTYELDTRSRLEHELIVAPTGHGKTQLLEWQILKDLQQPDPPATIVIDSKRSMVERLSRLALFDPDNGRLKDRIIYIDPRDTPALNIFDVPIPDEETANEVLAQLSYFIGELLDGGTSSSMDLVYRPLAQLMLHVPNANLGTLARAIDNIKNFSHVYDKLDPALRDFFTKDFSTVLATESKKAVKRRIFAATLQNPTFTKMFNARRNRLDLVDALNSGKIVLVSTEVRFLGADLSALFGKYIIFRVIAAALVAKGRPAFLYIDEAAPYTNEKIEELLSTLRSYKLGAVLAYQTFPNLPKSLQNAIRTNTTVKFIGGGDDDAAKIFAIGKDGAEFIYNQTVDSHEPPRFTRFAMHVKNKLKMFVSYQIPIANDRGPTELDRQPQMSDDAYRRFRALNKAALADDHPASPVPPRPDKNISEE